MQESKGFKGDIGSGTQANKIRKQDARTAKEKRQKKLDSLQSNPKSNATVRKTKTSQITAFGQCTWRSLPARRQFVRSCSQSFSMFSPSRIRIPQRASFGNYSWHHCGRNRPKIIEIATIVAIFGPFEVWARCNTQVYSERWYTF